jgi:hypothetical protein
MASTAANIVTFVAVQGRLHYLMIVLAPDERLGGPRRRFWSETLTIYRTGMVPIGIFLTAFAAVQHLLLARNVGGVASSVAAYIIAQIVSRLAHTFVLRTSGHARHRPSA